MNNWKWRVETTGALDKCRLRRASNYRLVSISLVRPFVMLPVSVISFILLKKHYKEIKKVNYK